jgi:hypothetical protein
MDIPRGDGRGPRRETAISMWFLAILLVVIGVLLARLVKAALKPALRPEPTQLELHLV